MIVAGNHDWASIGKTDITYFNLYGRKAILWTANVLSPHHKSFLAELPLQQSNYDWRFVHSTPEEPSEWHYIFTSAQAMEQFLNFEERICFIGHSHSPAIFTDTGDDIEIFIPFDKQNLLIEIELDTRYIINIGSVGQPRDGDQRGSIVIYDNEQETVKYIRFEYPIGRAQRKILDAGLPSFLSERLARGA